MTQYTNSIVAAHSRHCGCGCGCCCCSGENQWQMLPTPSLPLPFPLFLFLLVISCPRSFFVMLTPPCFLGHTRILRQDAAHATSRHTHNECNHNYISLSWIGFHLRRKVGNTLFARKYAVIFIYLSAAHKSRQRH